MKADNTTTMASDIGPPNSPTANAVILVVVALALGTIVRLAVVIQTPPPPMWWDHHEYVRWGVQMMQGGLLTVHEHVPPEVKMMHPIEKRPSLVRHAGDETGPCNYPPISVYLLYGQALVLKAVDPEMLSNSPAARFIYSFLSMLGDVVVALGCWAIVRRHGGRMAGAIAFAAAFLCPPFIIDSAHWGQTDSWVIAPLVWMVWAMMGRRWIVAGLLWGVALGIKPQAVLAGPIWMMAFFLYPQRLRILLSSLLGPIVLMLAGLPFTIGSGWAWFQQSYLGNLLHMYPDTTLKAFNVWYIDLLFSEDTDAMKTIMGITKDMWGKILLIGLFIVASVWTFWRGRGKSRSLLYYAAAWLLITVVAPTRVHERYIVLPIAFLICSAAMNRRLWWAVAPLILAATFQITSLEWLTCGAHNWGEITRDTYEQWAEMEKNMSPAELAAYPPPKERLELDRPRYVADRAATGDAYREWVLVILEVTSAFACLILLGMLVGKTDPQTCEHGLVNSPS